MYKGNILQHIGIGFFIERRLLFMINDWEKAQRRYSRKLKYLRRAEDYRVLAIFYFF